MREAPPGIVLNGRRWVNGLTWADLVDDLVIRKRTTKTGAFVAHDLKLCAFAMDLLVRIPPRASGDPAHHRRNRREAVAESAYAWEWRTIARAAGVLDHVWNMDARAGGITEAEDAGADLDMIRSAAHSNASTTQRYLRGPVEKTRAVSRLRHQHRATKN